MQLVSSFRLRARAIVVIGMALALILGALAAPARAGDDHDDLEAARGAALETVNYKINSLKECRESAKTDAAWSISSVGIEELGGIKERILGEDNGYEINELKSRAKAVWGDTKERAAHADEEAKDEGDKEGDDGDTEGDNEGDKKDEEEAAQRRKADEDRRHRDQDEAEAALHEARTSTIALIDNKYRLLMAASQSAHHQQMSDIYREAAMKVYDLHPDAEAADSIEVLEGIAGQVWEIIHTAKKDIDALRHGRDKDVNGDDNDDSDEGTDEEEQTISDALDALEAQTLLHQQAVANTIDPFSDTRETGAVALEAGDELLAAIAAARLAETEEEIVDAWEAVMAARNAYRIALIAHNNVAGDIFTGGDPFPT